MGAPILSESLTKYFEKILILKFYKILLLFMNLCNIAFCLSNIVQIFENVELWNDIKVLM